MSGIMTPLPPNDGDSGIPCVQQTTSFYEIPAEIRNEIYELAMPRKEEVKLIVASPAWDSLMTTGVQPGITRATRQTRAESLSMFYANNVLEAFIERFEFRQLVDFVRCATSGPNPPKLDIHLKLLHRMTCFRGLLDLACAWRQLKYQSVHITIGSCFFDGSRSRAQSEIVSEAMNIAERCAVARGCTDRDIRVEVLGMIFKRTGNIHMVSERACEHEDYCNCSPYTGNVLQHVTL